MATVKVKKTISAGADDAGGFKKVRSDRMDVGFGQVAADAYEVGDTLRFVEIGAKQLIKAEFVAASGATLDVLNSASLASPVTFDVGASGSTSAISYTIWFERGAGAVGGSSVNGEGIDLRVTVASTTNTP